MCYPFDELMEYTAYLRKLPRASEVSILIKDAKQREWNVLHCYCVSSVGAVLKGMRRRDVGMGESMSVMVFLPYQLGCWVF